MPVIDLPPDDFIDDLTAPAPAGEGVAGGTAWFAQLRNFVAQLMGVLPEASVTLASDTFNPAQAAYVLTSESGSADNLAQLGTANAFDGMRVQVRAASGHTITAKHNTGTTGKLLLADAADLVLSDPTMRLILSYSVAALAWTEEDRGYGANKTLLTAFLNAATAALKGIVELATGAETVTMTDATRAVTPAGLAALIGDGGDNANGATVTLGDGDSFNLITSTTTITAFVFSTPRTGRKAVCRANTVRTITHHATNLICPGGASIVTAVGDLFEIEDLGSSKARINWYTRADGTAVVASTPAAFSANKGGVNQNSISNGTETKVTFTNEVTDVGGYYDAVNSKWTPPAGRHLITASVSYVSANDQYLVGISLRKNGTAVAFALFGVSGTNVTITCPGTWIVDANGTDYFEIYGYIVGSSRSIYGDNLYTWFQGVRLP